VGKRDGVQIFGTDYDTPDGTGVRDYIHVEDLADAHLKALDYLRQGGESQTLNCGYGRGYSVRELIEMIEEVAGHTLKKTESPRRPGDPPQLIAAAEKIRAVLGWQPRYDDLEVIAASALRWERRLMDEQPYSVGDGAA
jgi:UDP-glucose 4-epimerase